MMETTLLIRKLFRRTLDLWGRDKQWDMVLEECAELSTAILHLRRARATTDQVAEEVADATIMLAQAREMIGPAHVDRIISKKLERLEKRVNHEEARRKAGLQHRSTEAGDTSG